MITQPKESIPSPSVSIQDRGDMRNSISDESWLHESGQVSEAITTPQRKDSIDVFVTRTTPSDVNGSLSERFGVVAKAPSYTSVENISFVDRSICESNDLVYLDEHELVPVVPVPFFNISTSILGYSKSRQLQLRMQGIVAIPRRAVFQR